MKGKLSRRWGAAAVAAIVMAVTNSNASTTMRAKEGIRGRKKDSVGIGGEFIP